MNIKPLHRNDAKALDALSIESKAVILFALKSLRNDVVRNTNAMSEANTITIELFEYYCKTYVHAQSLEMVLNTNQQPLTLSIL